jgi:hypothetical protein
MAYRGCNFSWLERFCIAFAFVAGALVAYAGFLLLDKLPRRWLGDIPEFGAAVLFFAVTGLILKGIDAMKNERINRLLRKAERRKGRPKNLD